MNVEYINPFIEAALSVIEMSANIKMERVGMSQKTSPLATHEVTVILGIAGDISGQVLYSFEASVALELAEKMIFTMSGMGMKFNEMDDMAKSAISEIGNMISGSAVSKMPGKAIDITPPLIIQGQGVSVSNSSMINLAVDFVCSVGKMELTLAFKEND